MSDAAHEPTTKKKSKGGGKLFIILCLLAIVGGAVLPMVINVPALLGKTEEPAAEEAAHGSEHDAHAAKPKTKTKPKAAKPAAHGKEHAEKTISVPFGDAIVNLADERLSRYLKVKIVLDIEGEEKDKEALIEHVNKYKPALKSWIISHVAGKSLKDVAGTVGVKRLQRELFEKFEEVLYPDQEEKLKDLFFEDYVVQ
jgi:flagellar protein FliL